MAISIKPAGTRVRSNRDKLKLVELMLRFGATANTIAQLEVPPRSMLAFVEVRGSGWSVR